MNSPARPPLLIVPIRDRRQRRRILTIRNCALTMLSLAVIVAAASLYTGAHGDSAGDYGRLYNRRVAAPARPVSRNLTVVEEGSVVDQAPDPTLATPSAREQLLMAKSNVDTAPPPAPATASASTMSASTTSSLTTTTTTVSAPITPLRLDPNAHGTTIVGDGKGIVVAHAPSTSTAPTPALAGGIFKDH